MTDNRLIDLCISKTALLLKQCYWPVQLHTSASSEHNPFSAIPSDINEKLISAVVELTPRGTLSVRQLYLILSSGRIKNFILQNVRVLTEELVHILTTLSKHGMQLNKLVLQNISCLESEDEKYQSIGKNAIESLLMMSPNLEHIQIGEEFDLKAIQHIKCLKHLELYFFPKNKLFDLIPKTDGNVIRKPKKTKKSKKTKKQKIDDYLYIPNQTITYIYFFENSNNRIPVEELAFLLQNCTELTCIRNNIAVALELLHSEEFFCGSLTKEYKLRKYVLGDTVLTPTPVTASVTVIRIATVTCPQTRELEILVNNHEALVALKDFKYLECICIDWEGDTAGDFRLGLQPLLQIIGPQLKDLNFANFSNIDFEIIGKFCPRLVELKIEYDDEVGITSKDHAYFTCLTYLEVWCGDISGMKSDTLLFLLRNCKELTSVFLRGVPCLTDQLLTALLKINGLSKLESVSLSGCSLTEEGLRYLVNSCSSLKFIRFSSSHLAFNDAVQIVNSMNPLIFVGRNCN